MKTKYGVIPKRGALLVKQFGKSALRPKDLNPRHAISVLRKAGYRGIKAGAIRADLTRPIYAKTKSGETVRWSYLTDVRKGYL